MLYPLSYRGVAEIVAEPPEGRGALVRIRIEYRIPELET